MKRDRLLTEGIWKALTSAAKRARRPAYVAVAYFGRNASKRLPLPPNSCLVVDASEHAVRCGQTCPAELKRLQQRGVVIYSAESLHAKVYVFDGIAFIGSANVSDRSAGTLTEAVVRTTSRRLISDARSFVRNLRRNELTPSAIDRLGQIYRPPRMQGNMPPARGRSESRSSPRGQSRLFIAQLIFDDPPSGSEETEEKGLRIARTLRKHGRSYVLQDFFWSGNAPYRRGDKVIQVLDSGGGYRLIETPGDVCYTRVWRKKDRRGTFVYLELPRVRRIRLERLARRLGYGAKKKLLRNGLVRNHDFRDALLSGWHPKG
jgi:phospholipase D-like protein